MFGGFGLSPGKLPAAVWLWVAQGLATPTLTGPIVRRRKRSFISLRKGRRRRIVGLVGDTPVRFTFWMDATSMKDQV